MRRAVELGLNDADEMTREPALKSLHGENEFDVIAADLPSPKAPDQIDELGVLGRSSVNEFVKAVNDDEDFRSFLQRERRPKGRIDRKIFEARRRVSDAGDIRAVTAEGNPPRQGEQDIPGLPQLRALLNRATKVSKRS